MKILNRKIYEGINIYSHYPVIKLTVDLGYLAKSPTNELGNFNTKLFVHIPSLQEHHCSRGIPGGFISRLNEGTYLGHVLEHVILELQYLAGMEVIYGKTFSTDEENVFEIVYEYTSKEGGLQAANSAIYIVKSLMDNIEVSIENEIRKIKEIAAKFDLGPSCKAIFQAAKSAGIPVCRVGQESILKLGYGKYQKKVEATITQLTSCIGVDIASDKALTKQLLSEAGIPVPRGGVARTENEALEIAGSIGQPVVVKPLDGNQGKGITLDLTDRENIIRAYAVAQNYSDKIIVEKYITGRHYRLLVVGQKVVAASERIPAFIEGDGKHNVQELVEFKNQDFLRGEGHEKPLTKIKIDPVVLMVLAKKDKTLDYIPQKGEIVYLRENANISTGGIAIDVTEEVHQENKELALRAARTIGLDVAGIDMVTKDISRPIEDNEGAVIEVNAAPGIRMHHFPVAGQSRNVAKEIVSMLFPPGAPSRIPIIAVTGTNGKTTTTRMIAHILSKNYHVGMATTDGIYIGGKIYVKGDTTGPQSAKVVLGESTVDIAVLETARGGILREGLGYDISDVGIVTNISSDHLGQGGVECLADLAYVKSIVAETVQKNGYAVLNADDKYVVAMREQVQAPIIYFSNVADNIVVRRHLGVGGKAVFIKNGYIVMAHGNYVKKIAPIRSVPITMRGLAMHNIQNVLAAVAGCYALDIGIDMIKQGLQSFRSTLEDNPGRLNLVEVAGIRVLIDYAHNVAGYESIVKLTKKMKFKKVIGVIGMPGDRPDKNIIDAGFVAGQGFKHIIIKEDEDLRHRQVGEVAALLKQGAQMGGLKEDKIQTILNEADALKSALLLASPEDLVVVFYEKLASVLKVINNPQKSSNLKLCQQPINNKLEAIIIS